MLFVCYTNLREKEERGKDRRTGKGTYMLEGFVGQNGKRVYV